MRLTGFIMIVRRLVEGHSQGEKEFNLYPGLDWSLWDQVVYVGSLCVWFM